MCEVGSRGPADSERGGRIGWRKCLEVGEKRKGKRDERMALERREAESSEREGCVKRKRAAERAAKNGGGFESGGAAPVLEVPKGFPSLG